VLTIPPCKKTLLRNIHLRDACSGVFDIAAGKEAEVVENMVLRRVCGPMRDEVTGEWRK